MVEDGALDINKFHLASGDKAYYKSDYYSDKAPGMTFSALPAIKASIIYLDSTIDDYKWLNQRGTITSAFVFVMQIATITTSGLMTALAALALYFVAIRLGAGLGGATFGALAYGLATPAWGWATAFFGHASAGASLFLGLSCILYMLDLPSDKRRDTVLGFLSGALLSWAVVIETTSAPASAIIVVYALVNARQWERERFIRVLLSALTGAVLFVLPLLTYNYAIYGNFFSTGYGNLLSFPGMKEGFYGINTPKVQIIVRLLVGIQNGILWFSPLLLFVPIALYRQWKTPTQKGLAITIIAVTLYYFLWNSGYTYWTGGGSTGPRFLTPILPFVCLSLALLWAKSGNTLKSGLLLLFAISFLISLMSVSVSMVIPYVSKVHILAEEIIPKFLEASHLKISIIVRLIAPSYDGTSYMHLVPFYVILSVGFIYILWELHKHHTRNNNS